MFFIFYIFVNNNNFFRNIFQNFLFIPPYTHPTILCFACFTGYTTTAVNNARLFPHIHNSPHRSLLAARLSVRRYRLLFFNGCCCCIHT
ncbi:unnamed protein product [Meloidogyne enterolobii]|uniref:Uncharacterized protein n=1 Tax=Meloidogyne enterolobii TaxID=390850 RepID=A0ACB1AEJ2_MELEN